MTSVTGEDGGREWHLGYIEDAATKRLTVYRANGSVFTDKASNYDPPFTGIHLCGQTDDGNQPTTVARYPMHRSEAVALHAAAKSVAECTKDEYDFVVDLFIRGDCDEDFLSNRQLWPRAIAAWNAAAHPTNTTSGSKDNG